MIRPGVYLLALVTGIAAYLACFVFVIEKPLTVGITGGYIEKKIAYLKASGNERKIAVFAGSNGRFSHRCEAIEEATGVKCVNLSVAAGFDLQWQLGKYQPYLKRGDVLYLPLEYAAASAASEDVGAEAPYVVRYDRAALATLYDWRRLAQALFYFDAKFLFSGVGEMLLAAAGKQRRFSADTLTPQGDEQGHTAAKGAAYRNHIASIEPPKAPAKGYEGVRARELDAILDWASRAGVIAVGGLPTTFEDAVLSPDAVAGMQRFYVERGHCFVTLPGRSLYPRTLFYDTAYHLNEEAQKQHSRALASPLANIVRSQRCAAAL